MQEIEDHSVGRTLFEQEVIGFLLIVCGLSRLDCIVGLFSLMMIDEDIWQL